MALAGFLLLSAGRACAQQETAPPRNAAAAAFAPIEDDPALPRVLMIGDSISVGYTLAVREALAGKANVHRPAANCGNTSKGLQYLSQWLGDGHWDVIHFNWGLHDLTSIDDKPEVPINEYEKNLRELVTRLKKTGATLIWCSTTPVPPGRRAPLKPEDVLRYNEMARKIMDENGIAIDDLYAFALPRLKEIQQPTNVHVTPEGSKVLAQQVAASIEAALQQRPAEKSRAPTADQASAAPKPLTDMTAKERSKNEDGGVHGGGRSTPSEAQLQQMLRRFPDADLNKDGKLTPEEIREFRRQRLAGGAAASSHPADAATHAPNAAAADTPLAGPVDIQITSDKPVPVNPRVYGIICEEMFVKDLVDEPEYIAALVDLKFKTFNYPGGSISYYHHPRGTGGFNIRPEEVRKSKHGDESRFMKEGSGPDHFEQYIQFVKASGGEAVFTANILNGTVAELDEFLSRLQAERIPIAAVVLGVEMHLGQAQALGLNGYLERIKPYIPMLQAKYPQVPIVAHSTPVGRVGDRAQASFHEWNQALARLPGIDGFSQYGWPEFGTDVRRLMAAAAQQTPGERWRQYDEFARTFPDRQLPAYQRDWGGDKKMYMLQWGTHLDRNTPVQGLHMANFYFFLAQYNAAHNDYFTVATSAPILAENASKGARRGGVIYKDKIALFASYLYTKPFRHLFSGDKKLLAASIAAADNDVKAGTVKALAAAGPDGRQFLYLINTGPAVALRTAAVDGKALPADCRVVVESAFADSFDAGLGFGVKTFTGEKTMRDLVLQPWSLTLVILPPGTFGSGS
jgi:acyl-CoA thioesterase-1